MIIRPNSSVADLVETKYRKRRSFAAGITLNYSREVLLFDVDGNYYQWNGTFPKTVPQSSTPTSTGGLGSNAWSSVGNADDLDLIYDKFDDVDTQIIQLQGQVVQGGKSAYQIWLEQGNTGTEQDFLDSLVGQPGLGLEIKGSLPSVNDLPTVGNTPGDAYIVEEQMWVWDSFAWSPVGQVGPDGKSAYEVWLDAGNTGSVADYLLSIRGARGLPGPTGATGATGQNANGFDYKGSVNNTGSLPPANNANISDAYTIGTYVYVSNGISWVNVGAIQGPPGPTGLVGPIGPIGPLGPDGRSAYQVWLSQGNSGTEQDFLDSLIGPVGPDGAQGEAGEGLTIQDRLNSVDDLPATGVPGEAYIIGEDLYVWLSSSSQFENVGQIQGIQGPIGPVGPTGATGADGQPGTSIRGLGNLATTNSLPSNANEGDTYYIVDTGKLYTYTNGAWVDMGVIRGLQGAIGPAGVQGIQGVPGDALMAKGYLTDTASLPTTGNSVADMYYVGANTYVWNGTSWVDMGVNIGPQGPQGIQGPIGPDGIQGPMGPGVKILGELPDTASLPSTGTLGEGYLIDSEFWVWNGSAYVNAGNIQGPPGPIGPVGPTGPQGTLWIVLPRAPGVADGRIGDFYLNSTTLQYYQKTTNLNWASMGYLGGGNVYDAPSDGNLYARKDLAWESISIPTVEVFEAPTDGNIYGRVNGAWQETVIKAPVTDGYYLQVGNQWKRLNRYDLAITSATTTLDVSQSQVFEVDLSVSRNLSFTNLPAGRAMPIVVIFSGNAGASWQDTIFWTDSVAPTYSNNRTTISILWTGSSLLGYKPGGY